MRVDVIILQRKEQNKDHIPRVEIWLEGHKRKNGKAINEAVEEKMVCHYICISTGKFIN